MLSLSQAGEIELQAGVWFTRGDLAGFPHDAYFSEIKTCQVSFSPVHEYVCSMS
jgi:hypothetical protein